MKKIYISCPIAIPKGYLTDLVEQVAEIAEDAEANVEIKHWNRNSNYNPSDVLNCDIFVIIHPNNDFNYKFNSLPAGCQQELNKAINLNKKIFGAYKRSDGTYFIYEVKITSISIELQKGTTNKLYEFLLDDSEFENDIFEQKEINNHLEERKIVVEDKIREQLDNFKGISITINEEEILLLLNK